MMAPVVIANKKVIRRQVLVEQKSAAMVVGNDDRCHHQVWKFSHGDPSIPHTQNDP
jgi:hypothetical protein